MRNFFTRRKDYAQLDDKELVALAKDDTEAFGACTSVYLPKIYSYVYYRTGNTHDAEDLTAKVFFRAMSHIGKYVDKGLPFQAGFIGSPTTWSPIGIAIRTAEDHRAR